MAWTSGDVNLDSGKEFELNPGKYTINGREYEVMDDGSLQAVWLPIETAPKNEKVLIGFEGGGISYAKYGFWRDKDDDYVGWHFYDCDDDPYYSVGWTPDDVQPTHWLPLPQPPKKGE